MACESAKFADDLTILSVKDVFVAAVRSSIGRHD
jgi:hypothetical protein